jgi:hypothetical protein
MKVQLISGIFLLLFLTSATSAGGKKDGENKRENNDGILLTNKGKEAFGELTQPTEEGAGQFAQSENRHAHELHSSALMPKAEGIENLI